MDILMCAVSGAPLCTALRGNHYERPSSSLSLQLPSARGAAKLNMWNKPPFYLLQVWSCQRKGQPSGLDGELLATAQRCRRALTSGAGGHPVYCSMHGTQGSCSRNHTRHQAGGAHWMPLLQPPLYREHTVQEDSYQHFVNILLLFTQGTLW